MSARGRPGRVGKRSVLITIFMQSIPCQCVGVQDVWGSAVHYLKHSCNLSHVSVWVFNMHECALNLLSLCGHPLLHLLH